MERINKKKGLSFLSGGGEMGEMIRNFRWSETAVGSIEQWPLSLSITLSNLLRSSFPTILFWGPENVVFYNDAFVERLGEFINHPYGLGKPAREVLQDRWEPIHSKLQKVVATATPLCTDDEEMVLERNGKEERTFWNNSYSQVLDEHGVHAGTRMICIETTEKVRSIQRLEASDQRFQSLVHQSTVGMIVLIGPEMYVAIVNDQYAKLIGRTVNDLLQNKLFDIIPEAEKDFRPILDGVRETGEPIFLSDAPFSVVSGEKTLDGFLNLVYQPYRNSKGEIIGTMVLCHDVTQEVEAKAALKKSEQRFQAAIEAVNGVLWTNSAEGKMEGEQPGWSKLTGQTIEEYQGYGWANSVHPEDAQPTIDAWNKALANNSTFIFEHRLKKQTGEWGHYAIRAIPLMNDDGTIREWVGVHTEVTEIKKAQEALKESEDNLRNIIVQAPVAMCIFMGPTFVVDLANERMYELWGRGEKDVLHRPIFEALPEAAGQGFEELVDGVYRTGKRFSAYGAPVKLPRNDRVETIYIDALYEAFRDREGKIIGVMAVAIDVTEQVIARLKIEEVVAERTHELAKANESLQKTNVELERSNANLEEFAYAASHDLKEPVRKIHFFSDLIRNSLIDRMDENEMRYFLRLEMASTRMGTLIDDLLSYSQVSMKAIEMETVDLNALVKTVLEDLDLEIEARQGKINMAKLPLVKGQKRQLQQAFQNLISNGLKYSRPGISPVIDISYEKISESNSAGNPHKGYHLITVSDNGIGFEQDNAEKIFNVFTRLHGSSEYKGTGVGLSIVRKVIENHGGSITAEGKPGEGARFKIELPE